MTERISIELPTGALHVTAALPELVSQRTSEQVLGVPKRQFLEALPSFEASGRVVARLGRLRLVDRADFVDWLCDRQRHQIEQHDDVAELAAELGLRRVGS